MADLTKLKEKYGEEGLKRLILLKYKDKLPQGVYEANKHLLTKTSFKRTKKSLYDIKTKNLGRRLKKPTYDENVVGLPKAKETEALIASRTPAGLTLQEELRYKPQNFRELAFKAPTLALKSIIPAFQKIESAIANPLIELQQADKPELFKRMAESAKQGLTSERIGELGDIPRRAGAPEPVSKAIGFGAAMATAFPLAGKAIKTIANVGRKTLGMKAITPLQSTMKNIRKVRWIDINLGRYESALYRSKLLKNLSKKERELIPFMREGQKYIDPITKKLMRGKGGNIPQKLKRPDLIQLIKDPKVRQKLGKFVEQDKFRKTGLDTINAYLDKAHHDLAKFHQGDIGFWENYVTHIWDIPKNKVHTVAKYFATKNPTLQKRYIATISEGVNKFNLKPKTLDIAEILGVYDNLRYTTIANNKLVQTLSRLGLSKRADKAPADWKLINHPAFKRSKIVKGKLPAGQVMLEPGKGAMHATTKGLLRKESFSKVHPEIAAEIESLLAKPFEAGWINKLESVNSLAKRLNLSLSMFHPVALFESSVATMGWRKTAAISLKALKDFAMGKDPLVFAKSPLTRDAIKHTLAIGMPTDAVAGKFYGMLDKVEKAARPGLMKAGVRGTRGLSKIWDKGLWDYFHNNLKLTAYEHLTHQTLKQAKYAKLPVGKVKQEVAQFVNDTFGGQAWDILGKSDKWVQSMHWALLSPDWTYSTLRQALAPTGIGAMSKETMALRKAMGNKFWMSAAINFWGGMNVLNYTISKKLTGRGRFMFDNPPDKKTQLFIGYEKDKYGVEREKYLRWGKQFRELPEFFMNPIGKFGGKLSPVARQTLEQFTKHSVGGYPTEFADKGFVQGMGGRVSHATKMFRPYSMSGQSLYGAFPTSKGMTEWKARQLFMQAIEKNDIPFAREIWQGGLKNNVDVKRAFAQARSILQSDSRRASRMKLGAALSTGKTPKNLSAKERRLLRKLMKRRRNIRKLKRKYLTD